MADASYLTGFGNHFASEAVPGALPVGQNSPQKPAFGLYAEQLSGTAFTMPRHENRRSWLYRLRPSAEHPAYRRYEGAKLFAPGVVQEPVAPNRLRWDPLGEIAEGTDFVDGLVTMLVSGPPVELRGVAVHVYAANRDMDARAFSSADGELLFIPYEGRLELLTELGRIEVSPGQIALVPRGLRFRMILPDGIARGYVAENHGSLFRLPDLGPIGANGLANPRDFETPAAWFEDRDEPTELIQKHLGSLWTTTLDHSPLDVVAWHGNHAPWRYDLARFNTINTVSFDHPDPSIFTLLTSPSDVPGRANVDFVIFPPRWMVAEGTFRPPWFHRNVMSEAMGLITGAYDAKAEGFVPGGLSLHNMLAGHGPDVATWDAASNAELKPHKITGTMAFMVETCWPYRPTRHALDHAQPDYDEAWAGFPEGAVAEVTASWLAIDETHDPARTSWVEGADAHPDFPVQNLPLGIAGIDGRARAVTAIGDRVLDLAALAEAGLLPDPAAGALGGATLNALFALPAEARRALRQRLSALLSNEAHRNVVAPHLHPADAAEMRLPCAIGDYTDFYVGIHHAENVGRLFRPDNPLLPNYKWVPIGYHGRASSVRVSGTPVIRPAGQRKAPDVDAPSVGPSRRLDYELELGLWIGAGNALGTPIPIGEAGAHIAGISLLNDWSARDLQAWEYQPLGPFLAKSFLTSVSPWVVTAEALAPFRVAQPKRPDGDPQPLPYLADAQDQAHGALGLTLDVLIATGRMREAGAPPHRLSRGPATSMYWTAAQIVAHHASNGCDLNPGDLIGTGTLSGPTPDSFGSLLELSRGGAEALTLPNGETRTFLDDGDELILAARAEREGFRTIGFGACRGIVQPAHAP